MASPLCAVNGQACRTDWPDLSKGQRLVEQQSIVNRDIFRQPETLEELGVPVTIVTDLMLRLLFSEGDVSLRRFADVLRIGTAVLDATLMRMQQEHIVDVSKAGTLGRASYIYALTDAGLARARDALDRSQYIGAVPVPIEMYSQAIVTQTQVRTRIPAETVQQAIQSLVLPEGFHRRIGPAVNTGSSLFLYGPPGNGKTTVAQAIAQLIAGTDPIWLPYAVTVGGQLIGINDPLVHKPIQLSKEQTEQLGEYDHRWALFERPTVMVGGELTMEALDLRYDETAKFYEGPLQLKANGGMFLIDDFGRQQVRPTDLLNRWIVPLEAGYDFLRLRTGQTMQVPFRQLIVFSTNLDPNELVDAAFLRRIQMKVEVGSPDERMFFQIFATMCQRMKIPLDKDTFLHLLQEWYRKPKRTFQAVHPRDILKIVLALCEYEGRPPQMSPQLIDEACRAYFVGSA
jgi:predicted ATPase with chaperone activity